MKKIDLEDQLRALGDPVRMRIVRLLALPARSRSAPDSGYCACDISAVMGVSQPTVSHHMKTLMQAGLVSGEKSGRWVYYRIQPSAFAELAQCFERFARQNPACADPGPVGAETDASGCAPASAGEEADLAARKLTVVARTG